MVAKDGAWTRGEPLRLEGVRVWRGGTEVLHGIDLALTPGRRYVILGPSGAGKSTLLRLLNRLEDPGAGSMFLGDRPYRSLSIREIRKNVGLVFQAPRPLPGTLAENLSYPSLVRGLRTPDAPAMAEALDDVGIEAGWLHREAAGLSGGERQRLAVALGAGPEVLAMDEPTSALDPASARRVASLLAARAEATGLRTVVVTHHRGHAPMLGDTGIRLEGGRIAEIGPLPNVLAGADPRLWGPVSPSEDTP